MSHSHSHSHHAHHGVHAGTDERRLAISLGLIAGLMVAEVAAGVAAHSLALLSDAAHMLTDVAALGLSILALRLAARPARGALTFGLGRAEILSAQANGVTLLVLAGLIVYSAVRRLVSPPHVHAWLLVWVALAGIVVTAAATATLARANRESMNVEGSFQHMLTDLAAFAGTLVAGLVIALTGFQRADPIASLVVATIMLRSAVGLIGASTRVFLEAAPEGLSPQQIGEALLAVPGVVEVHDLHVWEVTSGFSALSAHVLVAREADCHAARRGLEALLQDRFGVEHTTLQVDHEGEELIGLEVSPAAERAATLSPSGPATPAPARRDPEA
jgi:cobalt-zinc-cadmium efflux system protein